MKKVLIFGSFDIIHPGHLFLINEAKKHGQVYACLALDETIKNIKSRVPFNSIEQRAKSLEEYGVKIHYGDAQDRLKSVRAIEPDIVLLGHDQTMFVDQLEQYQKQEQPQLKIVRLGPFYPELFSSSKIRKVLEDAQAGFIIIDKPSGEPSLRTVSALRKLTGIKRIGFSGTLDPLASGVLMCGASKATTLLDWFHLYPKTYEATARLGFVSDTYDSEGCLKEIPSSKFQVPADQDIEKVVKEFAGESEQEPPMYSAKKHKGRKLYELARRGKEVERKKQHITIAELKVLSYSYPELQLRIVCSSGTYIRSLIHDIGQELGTGAIMTALRRTAIGPYAVDQAVAVRDLTPDNYTKHLISADEVRCELNNHYSSLKSRSSGLLMIR